MSDVLELFGKATTLMVDWQSIVTRQDCPIRRSCPLHDQDAVGVAQGGQPMGDEQHRTAGRALLAVL